jgi:homoserine dehydrogenase
MKPLRILMIGFGNVGKRLIHLLSDELPDHSGLADLHCQFTGIFTKHHGYIQNSNSIDLFGVEKHFGKLSSIIPDEEILQAISNSEYDVLVELSTLSIEQKGDPAISFVNAALQRGKHVVTANKGPAAFAYHEINELALKNNCRFLCESAVMDGTPVFSSARSGLLGAEIKAVSGILNTTTNLVLSKLENGTSFSEAVQSAQKLGFAEADPSNDLDGWDAAAKTAVLANILMDGSITPFDVRRTGIKDLNNETIANAARNKKRFKLICRAEKSGTNISAKVAPELLPYDHPFASVNGTDSILKIETDLMGPIFIRQENPTLNDTAYGVLNDLLTITRESN